MAVSFVKVCYLAAPARRLIYIWYSKKVNGIQEVNTFPLPKKKGSASADKLLKRLVSKEIDNSELRDDIWLTTGSTQ